MTSVGRTIQLFLVDGQPSGLRKATIRGWTGLLFVSGDAALGDLTRRVEVDRTGIYILRGPDPEQRFAERVYIGSGNSVAERIKQSALKREFWETAYTFTTSDDDLSKGHSEYLEARLIELVGNANRVALDNLLLPDKDRRRLPEADQADMEHHIANLKLILPVVGLDILKPPPRALIDTDGTAANRSSEDIVFEIRHKSGVFAEMVEEDGEFIVLKGSEALIDTDYALKSYVTLKSKLLEEEILEPAGSGKLRFSKPYAFRSLSAAAAVVLDRNSNGHIEWKLKGSNLRYHDWQQQNSDESDDDIST